MHEPAAKGLADALTAVRVRQAEEDLDDALVALLDAEPGLTKWRIRRRFRRRVTRAQLNAAILRVTAANRVRVYRSGFLECYLSLLRAGARPEAWAIIADQHDLRILIALDQAERCLRAAEVARAVSTHIKRRTVERRLLRLSRSKEVVVFDSVPRYTVVKAIPTPCFRLPVPAQYHLRSPTRWRLQLGHLDEDVVAYLEGGKERMEARGLVYVDSDGFGPEGSKAHSMRGDVDR